MKSTEGLVKCPYCGYSMPIKKGPSAVCSDMWVKCKGRNCGKEFEIKVNKVDK